MRRRLVKYLSDWEETIYTKNTRVRLPNSFFELVKDDSTLRTYALLADSNKIAARLWSQVDNYDPPHVEFNRWLSKAVNHTAGILTNFWLHSLQCWRNRQEPKPNDMNEQYCNAFSNIVNDDTVIGTFGRAVLACDFSFLLASDEVWTKENLLPWFSKNAESDDFVAVWDGFFVWKSQSDRSRPAEGAPSCGCTAIGK